ncbi:MAG TPA: hypothetical protein VFA18_24540, partial [Gemmataceae bacterium]|nr:hypothetical protein [Gemmataceae bacterium]
PPERLRPDEREHLNQLRRVEQYHKDRAALHRDEAAFTQRVGRFVALDRALKGLRGTNVLSCALIWEDGYPLGGDSALSHYFDDHPFRSAIWLQAAGNARDQSWSGLFQDIDGNGVLEFATVPVQRSQDWWKAELNFLSWKPAGKPRTADLPAGIPIRVSLQWREAHDPDFFKTPGDPYLRPLAHLRVLVLRQLDPTGTKLPSDDFEVVAASEIPAQRLDNFPESATYEQSVVFTPDRPGRYAIRVEGTVPDDTRPPEAAVLPGQKVAWELRPRLFVDVADARARAKGRPVLGSFAARTGSIGVPGDARTLLTVGAAALTGEPQPYATDGPPYNLRLLSKPDLLAYDAIQVGSGQPTAPTQSSLDTAFAAGMAATAISAGMPKPVIYDAVHTRPGKVWKLR